MKLKIVNMKKFMLENAGENSECIKIHQHKERT